MRLFGRIDRAVVRELRGPTWLGVGAFSLILLLNFIFVLVRGYIERGLPLHLVFEIAFAQVPNVLIYSLPMGTLVGVLVGIGRLSTQSEMVALSSAGVSPYRVARPVLLYAAFLTLLGLICGHFLRPAGAAAQTRLYRESFLGRDLNREIDPNVFFDRIAGSVLYADRAVESADGRVFEGVMIRRDNNENQTVELILAQRARAVFNAAMGQVSLLLDQGEWHILKPGEPRDYDVVRFAQNTLTLPPDPAILIQMKPSTQVDPTLLRGAELLSYVRKARGDIAAAETAIRRDEGRVYARTAVWRQAAIEWHHRWALPLTSVTFALVGFPVAARSRRGGRFGGLAQSLVLILVFWLLYSIGRGFSDKGTWPPWLGMWLPVLASSAWASWLWWRASRLASGRDVVDWRLVRSAFRRVARRIRTTRGAADEAPGSPPSDRFWRVGPARIDWFLGAGYVRMFGAVLFVLLALGLAVGFRSVVDNVDPQARVFPWAEVGRYLILSTIPQLRLMVPLAALFGAAICLSALMRTGEIVALKASGIGPVRIATPLLLVTVGIASGYALVQETFMPAAARASSQVLMKIQGKTGPEILESGTRWLAGEPGHIWNYVEWDERTRTLLRPGVLVVDLPNARLKERIEAASAAPTDTGWEFRDGWRRTFGDGTETFETFAGWTGPYRETAELFGARRSSLLEGNSLADQRTFSELWIHLKRTARAGYPTYRLVVGLNEKVVFPLLPLLLLMVGIPVTISGWQRRGGLYGFGVAILLVFAFFTVYAMTTSLGRQGIISPVFAVWIAPTIVVTAGGFLLARAR